MHFGGALTGSSAPVSGSQTVQSGVTPIQGEYKLTKISG
jgi:hypothetical protein